jgi:hypothetical protein
MSEREVEEHETVEPRRDAAVREDGTERDDERHEKRLRRKLEREEVG